MMRVLAQGMRELGLDPGDESAASGEARVPLRVKQELVQSAVRQGGLACLHRLGRGLHRLAHEPTHHALTSAPIAGDLFQRWQRLERYIHSRHRCIVESCDEERARLRHVNVKQGNPPSVAEDLVVAGVLAALLEAIGLQGVELRLGTRSEYRPGDPQDIADAAAKGVTSTWNFHWEGQRTRGGEALLAPTAGGSRPDQAWNDTARAAYVRLADSLVRPLGLAELAADMGIPGRTLQRRLGGQGLSYSKLLAEARCRTGAWRLLNTMDPIAEVGFLSGFSDQSHFTREMQRRVGVPPAAYREAFGRPGAGIGFHP